MTDEITLHLDYGTIALAHEWENIVCQAVDELAQAERDGGFVGKEHKYFYIGYDAERGKLWTSDEALTSGMPDCHPGGRSNTTTGSLRAAARRGRGRVLTIKARRS